MSTARREMHKSLHCTTLYISSTMKVCRWLVPKLSSKAHDTHPFPTDLGKNNIFWGSEPYHILSILDLTSVRLLCSPPRLPLRNFRPLRPLVHSAFIFLLIGIGPSPFRHNTLLTILTHPNRLPDILLLTRCLDQIALCTIFAEGVSYVFAGILMGVPVTHLWIEKEEVFYQWMSRAKKVVFFGYKIDEW